MIKNLNIKIYSFILVALVSSNVMSKVTVNDCNAKWLNGSVLDEAIQVELTTLSGEQREQVQIEITACTEDKVALYITSNGKKELRLIELDDTLIDDRIRVLGLMIADIILDKFTKNNQTDIRDETVKPEPVQKEKEIPPVPFVTIEPVGKLQWKTKRYQWFSFYTGAGAKLYIEQPTIALELEISFRIKRFITGWNLNFTSLKDSGGKVLLTSNTLIMGANILHIKRRLSAGWDILSDFGFVIANGVANDYYTATKQKNMMLGVHTALWLLFGEYSGFRLTLTGGWMRGLIAMSDNHPIGGFHGFTTSLGAGREW
ncbi:MAG: hypothetical protein JXR91_11870 [Deltaproteobacteria bacterium]|nr:hypothetical protein [Deltaproteobacteria bacterium]